MSLIIVLLIGVVIGMLVSRFIFREKPVGSLRVDESVGSFWCGCNL